MALPVPAPTVLPISAPTSATNVGSETHGQHHIGVKGEVSVTASNAGLAVFGVIVFILMIYCFRMSRVGRRGSPQADDSAVAIEITEVVVDKGPSPN